ncbi:hypothetical protein PQ469_18045 [Mucilaginibacter sp. KACC 22773]|jgi:rRNA-processing protein FCF1|uniref:hypothetical protein n=1 Tax=Mucilaginibacter sp. KACC 22773 TaxID=3025671 RepID=UPI0023663B05|nr:hypothetical protein [Mucilaginibacter sp. KACC 22773]WDF75791.1 hypothetical protein PQ469_18045 [Mucilaginibacter sp. KACC 22773]
MVNTKLVTQFSRSQIFVPVADQYKSLWYLLPDSLDDYADSLLLSNDKVMDRQLKQHGLPILKIGQKNLFLIN